MSFKQHLYNLTSDIKNFIFVSIIICIFLIPNFLHGYMFYKFYDKDTSTNITYIYMISLVLSGFLNLSSMIFATLYQRSQYLGNSFIIYLGISMISYTGSIFNTTMYLLVYFIAFVVLNPFMIISIPLIFGWMDNRDEYERNIRSRNIPTVSFENNYSYEL